MIWEPVSVAVGVVLGVAFVALVLAVTHWLLCIEPESSESESSLNAWKRKLGL